MLITDKIGDGFIATISGVPDGLPYNPSYFRLKDTELPRCERVSNYYADDNNVCRSAKTELRYLRKIIYFITDPKVRSAIYRQTNGHDSRRMMMMEHCTLNVSDSYLLPQILSCEKSLMAVLDAYRS